jgi:hypothetical protein
METVSTKAPNDIANEVERLADEENITQSEAIRRLLRKGIEAEKKTQQRHDLSPFLGAGAAAFGIPALITLVGGDVSISATMQQPSLFFLLAVVLAFLSVYIRVTLGR